MTFVPGFNSRYFVGPQRWSVYARGMSAGVTVNQIDTSGMEDRSKVWTNGQTNGSCTMDMMLDMVGSGQFTLANTWQATPQPITLGFTGATAGAGVWMMQGNQSKAAISSPLSDVSLISVDVQPDGPVDWGVMLEAETAISANTNGASVNNGAATANGAVAHLHVTGFSGLTNNTIRIEHSTDNASWVTLATFAVITGTTSERLVVAPGTQVRQYVRAVDTISGVGSCTRAISFARR